MTSRKGGRLVAFALAGAMSMQSLGRTRLAQASPPTATSAAVPMVSIRSRFGTDLATRLMRSTDADERLRGIRRIAAMQTPDGLMILERTSAAALPGSPDPRMPLEGIARSDPRALLAAVRGLATWMHRETAHAALASIVAAPTQSLSTHAAGTSADDSSGDDAAGASRVLLARQTGAIALAESGELSTIEALLTIARSAGPGQGPALDALAIHPPALPVLGGVELTTAATISLASVIGDLRSLDAIESAMSASDPGLRAAALIALGSAGDSRVLDAARAALHDADGRVRLAGGDALVHLGAPDAAAAVETLVADDATALEGLSLAQLVQGDGVTKAAAARAAASANPEIRSAALAALGRQTSPMAISALMTLLVVPAMEGDAACAIARSPSSAALPAIETMAGVLPTRRLAARAYFVRRLMRSARSAGLDGLLRNLSRANDARDRAVGVQALVALGELSIAHMLEDADPRVRRAAAMGALSRDTASRDALVARLDIETDDATKRVLALGLIDGDGTRIVPTVELRERARAGGPDAPLATFALAQRADEESADEVDAMLQSRDSVIRAHAARGLGPSVARDKVGRLARAYAVEGNVEVRRAIIRSLASMTGEAATAPVRRVTLALAARLDPDRFSRSTAARALDDRAATRPATTRDTVDVAWLRIVPAPGATIPPDMTATLVASDGVALPIVFDEDGYALISGVPAGDARLRLASRPAAYKAPPP